MPRPVPSPVRLSVFALGLAAVGCVNVPPPASPMPDAESALLRASASSACGTGLQANAKLDHFGEHGRFRGDLLMFAAAPARLRMDVVSPFGVALATLTTDGARFALSDLRDKRFYEGPASACNIARLTSVPLPAHVLVSLLRGRAPMVKHAAGAATIAWDKHGYYAVRVQGTRDAVEELRFAPHPADAAKPWAEQRMRLLDVKVTQYGRLAWHATLDEHAPAPMATPRIDPDGIDAPVPPSGPECTAEAPRRVHVEVPDDGQDVRIRYDQITWNPPLPDGTFAQQPQPGLPVEAVDCADGTRP